jgi:hypothetical protein
MPKPILIASGVVVAAVVIGGAVFLGTKKDTTTNNDKTSSSAQTSDKKITLNDPNGDYKLFSDPSVTKKPANDVKFGNGQTLTFEYDGSKTNNDADATLTYQLYYIQDDGKVQPMGGGNMEGDGGKGTFTVSNKVFNSSAKNRDGFLELTGTYDTGFDENYKITGKNVKLGMYSVKFDVSE